MKVVFLFLSLLVGANAHAVVVSEKTVTLPVDISTTVVRSSNAGYGNMFVVKVFVPQIADVTLLNHRNPGAEAPCLATYQTRDPNNVIKGNPSTENIDFKITLERDTYAEGTVCKVSLTEKVNATIRGYLFEHQRTVNVEDRELADCR